MSPWCIFVNQGSGFCTHSTYTLLCTHLLPFVLGQVGLELEVGLELAGTELALVGAVDHNYLFGLSLALLVLVGLHLYLRMPVLHGFPSAALRINLSLSRTLLQLPWSFCNQALYLFWRLDPMSIFFCPTSRTEVQVSVNQQNTELHSKLRNFCCTSLPAQCPPYHLHSIYFGVWNRYYLSELPLLHLVFDCPAAVTPPPLVPLAAAAAPRPPPPHGMTLVPPLLWWVISTLCWPHP